MMKKQFTAIALASAVMSTSAIACSGYYGSSVVSVPTASYVVASPVVVSTPVVSVPTYVVSSPVVTSRVITTSSPVIYSSGNYCEPRTVYYSY